MTWNDFVHKVTSRKFILALSAFLTSTIALFGGDTAQATKIVAIITNALTVIGYAFVEGYVDSKREEGEIYEQSCDYCGEQGSDLAGNTEDDI